MIASEPLPHFVDDLLGYLHETHPTHATLDGVHTHDDLLEDVSRQSIDTETHALAGYLRRLDEINKEALTPLERLEHRMLTANLQSRMFELEAVRTWDKNPQFYSDLLASSLAGQTLFSHAPASERARRVLSKLRQTPRLVQAARDNIRIRRASSSKSASRRCAARSGSSTRSCRARLPPSTTCTCSATSPTRRPKHRTRSHRTCSISRPRLHPRLARPSVSDGRNSNGSFGWTRGCRFRWIASSRLPSGSSKRRRRPSSR